MTVSASARARPSIFSATAADSLRRRSGRAARSSSASPVVPIAAGPASVNVLRYRAGIDRRTGREESAPMKLLYKPFGILLGILAGFLGRRALRRRLGASSTTSEPPKPTTEQHVVAEAVASARRCRCAGVDARVARARAGRPGEGLARRRRGPGLRFRARARRQSRPGRCRQPDRHEPGGEQEALARVVADGAATASQSALGDGRGGPRRGGRSTELRRAGCGPGAHGARGSNSPAGRRRPRTRAPGLHALGVESRVRWQRARQDARSPSRSGGCGAR